MTERPTGRPIARLATELRFTGLGQIAIGVGGVVAALIAADESAVRLMVPFVIVVVLIGGLSIYNTAWLRKDAPAGRGEGSRVETTSGTYRRSAVGLVLALLAVALVGAFGPSLAAILGGVVAAVGLVDLYNDRWVRAREASTGEALFRELGRSPFSPGRRPLYTRPLNDSTLAM